MAILSFFPAVPIISVVNVGIYAHYSGGGASDVWLGKNLGLVTICAQLIWILI